MKPKHERLRVFNKRILNPLMRTFAGKKYAPLAVLRHVGRRSGTAFETPIIVEPVRSGFVIALTYGADVDWYRNLTAAGGGTVRRHGKEYVVGPPEPIDSAIARPQFPLPLRIVLKLNRTDEFVLVRSKGVVPTR